MTWLDDRLEEAGTLQILTYLEDGPPVGKWSTRITLIWKGEQPQLGDLLSMVINILESGNI